MDVIIVQICTMMAFVIIWFMMKMDVLCVVVVMPKLKDKIGLDGSIYRRMMERRTREYVKENEVVEIDEKENLDGYLDEEE